MVFESQSDPKGGPYPIFSQSNSLQPHQQTTPLKGAPLIPQVFIPILAVVFSRFLPSLVSIMWINSASGSIPIFHPHSTRKSGKYAKFLI